MTNCHRIDHQIVEFFNHAFLTREVQIEKLQKKKISFKNGIQRIANIQSSNIAKINAQI